MTLSSRLQALRELAENATPGPWTADADPSKVQYESSGTWVWGPDGDGLVLACGSNAADFEGESDAAYIAAANPRTLTALLDVVQRGEEVVHAERHGDIGVAIDALVNALSDLNSLLETENGGEG